MNAPDKPHQPPEYVHRDEREWETIRWPGQAVYHPDPHFEQELVTETGGEMVFVQYPGPTTGGRPIYDGRFNLQARKPLSEERTDR